MEKLKIFLNNNNINYSTNVDLKRKTWIKTGGIASVWIVPCTIEELISIGRYIYREGLNFEIVGYTSNIFFTNAYNPEIVISTIKLKNYFIEENKAICDCGVQVSALSKEFVKFGYMGYYGLIDLPGTIAAAVHNNAGCFNCSVSAQLDSIIILSEYGDVITLDSAALEFSHRSSILKENRMNGIILQVILNVNSVGSNNTEPEKSKKVHEQRVATQGGPAKNLGSVHSLLKMRKNIWNIIIRLATKLLKLTSKQRKRLALSLYGYRHLDNYISDKGINTFIWQDGDAEKKFEEYSIFINKMHRDVKREIEIKNGK